MNALEAIDLIKLTIDKGTRHANYKRTVQLADEYFRFYTGYGIDELLRQVVTRESNVMFEQRKRLTQSVTVPVLNSTKLPFQKVIRSRPIAKEIIWEQGTFADKLLELTSYLETFNGDKSLEDYLDFILVEFNFVDPNAFCIIEFDAFDANKEKAEPYPLVATSKQAINYEYRNGHLQWLLVMWSDRKYVWYSAGEIVQFNLLTEEQAGDVIPDQGNVWTHGKDRWLMTVYTPNSEQVPAIRLGFIPDSLTIGATCTGIFHAALPLLHKTLKINSELDLSTALVAHPQILAYQNPCTADGCNAGSMPDGATCTECRGTGIAQFSTTVQDMITLRMPRLPEEVIDLDKLLVYKAPPVELIRFQTDYVEKLKVDIHKALFNADVFSRNQVAETATENLLERDNMDDTLYPFAQLYSRVYKYLVTQVATYLDLGEGLRVVHEMPRTFKFKTVQELLGDLKAARDANASASTITAIEADINDIIYADRPEEVKRLQIRQQLNPFNGFDTSTVMYVLSTQPIDTKAVAWSYFEAIMQDLEAENREPWLYDMTLDKIRGLFDAKVTEYMALVARPQVAQAIEEPDSSEGVDMEDEEEEEGGDTEGQDE